MASPYARSDTRGDVVQLVRTLRLVTSEVAGSNPVVPANKLS